MNHTLCSPKRLLDYALGSDPRYRNADWPTVEQAARPGWEERNPGTWEQFKETIQYAWDKARGQC
jgi:hypothetical protein